MPRIEIMTGPVRGRTGGTSARARRSRIRHVDQISHWDAPFRCNDSHRGSLAKSGPSGSDCVWKSCGGPRINGRAGPRRASRMSAAVSLKYPISSSGSPDVPNRSSTPMRLSGTGAFSPSTSATAEPSPPMMLCSSHVTTWPVFLALATMVSTSMRLDGGDVDDLGRDAVAVEPLGGGERLGDHDAAGDERHVRALAQHVGLAERPTRCPRDRPRAASRGRGGRRTARASRRRSGWRPWRR